jgi:transketolase C-terminal domain/subunit
LLIFPHSVIAVGASEYAALGIAAAAARASARPIAYVAALFVPGGADDLVWTDLVRSRLCSSVPHFEFETARRLRLRDVNKDN